mgnify:CR=1 FL=1
MFLDPLNFSVKWYHSFHSILYSTSILTTYFFKHSCLGCLISSFVLVIIFQNIHIVKLSVCALFLPQMIASGLPRAPTNSMMANNVRLPTSNLTAPNHAVTPQLTTLEAAKTDADVEPEPEADFEDVNDVQTYDEYTPRYFHDGGVWCGGVMWCGVVWCGVVWYGTTTHLLMSF